VPGCSRQAESALEDRHDAPADLDVADPPAADPERWRHGMLRAPLSRAPLVTYIRMYYTIYGWASGGIPSRVSG